MKRLLIIGLLATAFIGCNPETTEDKVVAYKYTDKYVFVGYYDGNEYVVEDTAAFLQSDSTWKMKSKYKGKIIIIK